MDPYSPVVKVIDHIFSVLYQIDSNVYCAAYQRSAIVEKSRPQGYKTEHGISNAHKI